MTSLGFDNLLECLIELRETLVSLLAYLIKDTDEQLEEAHQVRSGRDPEGRCLCSHVVGVIPPSCHVEVLTNLAAC